MKSSWMYGVPRRGLRCAVLILSGVMLNVSPISAQTSVVATRPPQPPTSSAPAVPDVISPLAGPQRATRAELTARLERAEATLVGRGVQGDARVRAMAEVAALRQRLSQGDFRVGDRFVVSLRHDAMRVDTAAVRDSLRVSLFTLPDLSLEGVLRAELDERVTAHVARYLRNFTVRTNPLTRIAILGAVRMPGFYYVSPDRPLSDLVMIAGGPAPDADLDQFEIRRSTTRLIKGKESRRFIKEGRTLEQVDVQSGDEAHVAVKRKANWQTIVQLFFVLSSMIFTAVQFLQWYYNRQNLY
ncbi:MAG: hypothetical protein RLZZ621_629 [Gemmatimonadota bacterium]